MTRVPGSNGSPPPIACADSRRLMRDGTSLYRPTRMTPSAGKYNLDAKTATTIAEMGKSSSLPTDQAIQI